MATEVRGPAAYFPSIEKKYGRSSAGWRELMAATGIGSTWSTRYERTWSADAPRE